MPPKKDKQKEQKLKNQKIQNAGDAEKRMKLLLHGYEILCRTYDIAPYMPLKRLLKTNLEESKLQTQFLFDPIDRKTSKYWDDEMLPNIFNLENSPRKPNATMSNPWLIKILPLLETIRNTRYIFIQELLVWGMKVDFEEVTCLAYLINKKVYMIARLELINCLLDEACIAKLLPTINKCSTLRELILDCNEFGDNGCIIICKELKGCSWLYQLSLNHCGITYASAMQLGELISSSSIRELFLEGNSLQNEGVIIMLGVINEAITKRASIIKFPEEKITSKDTLINNLSVKEEIESNPDKKKKPKKSKAKKTIPLPKGPEICKLNIANNNIGRFGVGENFAPVFSMQLIRNLIFTCKELEEIDLFANDIGDVAARLILDALTMRKLQKYPQIGIRMCHLINQDIYESICKLAPGSKKKKRSAQ